MKRSHLLKFPTEPLDVSGKESMSEFLEQMRLTAFQGRKLAEIADVWTRMLKKKNCIIWLGLAGALVPAGMRRIIAYLIRRRMIDVLVSTGANLYHDCFEAKGEKHYVGTHFASDVQLRKQRVDRIYDVFADERKFYQTDIWIEKEFCPCLADSRPYSSREVLHLLGKMLEEKGQEKESILVDAYKSKVPIFCPAIGDSALGFAMMFANRRRGRRIVIDSLKDVDESSRITEKAKMTGVVYLGGGVPKNFIQQTAVIASYQTRHDKSHSFAAQMTMDMPVWGGLSGCTFEEAQSWGKIGRNARTATCYVDVTLALPLIARALAERFRRLRRSVPFYDWGTKGLKISYEHLRL
jgi:deoxyhypusine synthase